VYNPADDSLVGEVNLAGPAEVDAAVSAAREAFETGPWSKFTGAQRAALMNKLADLIDANGDEIAKAEVQAMGQPIAVASGWIIPAASATWRHYAGQFFEERSAISRR
tara:strand:- start:7666 stop:7989 length:324 start_codon:yes stop_codon:yes gene_type:complete